MWYNQFPSLLSMLRLFASIENIILIADAVCSYVHTYIHIYVHTFIILYIIFTTTSSTYRKLLYSHDICRICTDIHLTCLSVSAYNLKWKRLRLSLIAEESAWNETTRENALYLQRLNQAKGLKLTILFVWKCNGGGQK